MSKKELGAFYTTNAGMILKGLEHLVDCKPVVDLFAGDGDLLQWAENNGASELYAFDVNPKANSVNAGFSEKVKKFGVLDTILNKPDVDLTNCFGVFNPPYLARNKTINKDPFDKWGVNDLYKASILSIMDNGIKEGIMIIPSNFWFDEDVDFRKTVLTRWCITDVKIFDRPVFDDTTVRITSFYFKDVGCGTKPVTTSVQGQPIDFKNKEGKWRPGIDWYNLIAKKNEIKVSRILKDVPTPKGMFETKIKLFGTDTGSQGGEIRVEYSEDIYRGIKTDRNFFTAMCNVELTKDQQLEIVKQFNDALCHYRRQYNSCFLTNFLASNSSKERKRISFSAAYKLLSVVIEDVLKGGA